MNRIRTILILFISVIICNSCEKEPESISVTGLSLNTTSLTIEEGSTGQISATVSPNNASNKVVIWTTDNSAIATVNSSGLVTGIATGTAKVTAKSDDGGLTAVCTVNVKPAKADGITLDKTALTLKFGETAQLTASTTPKSSSPRTVAWQSSDTDIVTVSNGLVNAVGPGTATVTATVDDVSASCDVTVNVDAKLISSIECRYTSLGSVKHVYNISISYDSQDRIRLIKCYVDQESERGGMYKAIIDYQSDGKASLIDLTLDDDWFDRREMDLTLNSYGYISKAVNICNSSYGAWFNYDSKGRITGRTAKYSSYMWTDINSNVEFSYDNGCLSKMNLSASSTSSISYSLNFKYGNKAATDNVEAMLFAMLLNNASSPYFFAGILASNLINHFPGNTFLMESISGYGSGSISYRRDLSGHIQNVTMTVSDENGEDKLYEFNYSYVDKGTQSYQWEDPFTYSGMGGTTWVSRMKDDDGSLYDSYIIFLDGNRFYRGDIYESSDLAEFMDGTYTKSGSSITLYDEDGKLMSGIISGNSIKMDDGVYEGGAVFNKTSNFKF